MKGDMNEKVLIKPKETDNIFDARTYDFTINYHLFNTHRCTSLIVLINLLFQN